MACRYPPDNENVHTINVLFLSHKETIGGKSNTTWLLNLNDILHLQETHDYKLFAITPHDIFIICSNRLSTSFINYLNDKLSSITAELMWMICHKEQTCLSTGWERLALAGSDVLGSEFRWLDSSSWVVRARIPQTTLGVFLWEPRPSGKSCHSKLHSFHSVLFRVINWDTYKKLRS